MVILSSRIANILLHFVWPVGFSLRTVCVSDWGSSVSYLMFLCAYLSVFLLFSQSEPDYDGLWWDFLLIASVQGSLSYSILVSLLFLHTGEILIDFLLLLLNISFKVATPSVPLGTTVIPRFGLLLVSLNFWMLFWNVIRLFCKCHFKIICLCARGSPYP